MNDLQLFFCCNIFIRIFLEIVFELFLDGLGSVYYHNWKGLMYLGISIAYFRNSYR